MFRQLARTRRKPSGESPRSMSRADSGGGNRASRKGAGFCTWSIRVSGAIHFDQAAGLTASLLIAQDFCRRDARRIPRRVEGREKTDQDREASDPERVREVGLERDEAH